MTNPVFLLVTFVFGTAKAVDILEGVMLRFRNLILFGTLVVAASASAQTYDIVSGFSTAANPSAPWKYGSVSSFTDSTFSSLGSSLNSGGFQGWATANGLSGLAVVKNTSGSPATIGTGSFVNNSVVLLPTAAMATLVFTAPTAGVYNLSGNFNFVATAAGSDGVSVGITSYSGTTPTTLLASTDLNSGSDKQTFNVTTGNLAAGSTIYFMASRGAAGNRTGDAVRLSGTLSAVPEPASMVGLGMGALALLRRRRNRK